MRGTITYKWQPGNHRTKYGAKATVYNGKRYDSKAEARYAETLDWRKMAGEITEIIPHFRIGIYFNDVLFAKWTVDFKVTLKDGTVELHEVKGMEGRDYILKRKAFLNCQDSRDDNDYIAEYKNGQKIDKSVKLIVIK